MGTPHRLGVAFIAAVTAIAALGTVAPSRVQGGTTTNLAQTYEIAATLDVASATLDAVETLRLTNRAAVAIDHVNLSVISRALGYVSMDEAITVDGRAAATSWTTGTNLRVDLEEPLEPGAEAVIVVPFRLALATSAPPFTARLSVENGVLSFGHWFPILSREHDAYGIGDPEISFTADRIRLDLTTTSALPRDAVACPGLASAPAVSGTDWTCEVEHVRDFSFVVNPDFRLTQRTVGTTELRVYTETVSGDLTADKALTALIGMEEAFGEYPWPDLVLAEVGSGDGYSMEYPRAAHLTRTKVTDSYVIYHEVAHQWFYAQLGNDQLREPWLDEGLADFSARYLLRIGTDHCSTRDVDSPVFAWPAGPISGGDWASCDGYFHTVIYKGGDFVDAVRAAMGEQEFFAAMREFIDRYRHGVVSTRRLLGHLQARSDVDLLPIFRAYLAEYDEPPPPVPSRPDTGPTRRVL